MPVGGWGVDVYIGDWSDPKGISVFQVKYFPMGLGSSQKDQVRRSFRSCLENEHFTMSTAFKEAFRFYGALTSPARDRLAAITAYNHAVEEAREVAAPLLGPYVAQALEIEVQPLSDKLLVRKRAIIESIIDQLKNISQIEHSCHRSPTNFVVHLIAGLLAYSHQAKKPGLHLDQHLLLAA